MKREPLKIGERVRVFSHYGPYDGEVTAVEVRGNTPRGFVDGLIRVKNSDGEEWFQHPRQCVRLRRRERSEKRERILRYTNKFLVDGRCNGRAVPLYESSPACQAGFKIAHGTVLRLVELRPGEVVLSRAELEKAWDSLREKFSHAVNSSHTSNQFYFLAKALGLGAE